MTWAKNIIPRPILWPHSSNPTFAPILFQFQPISFQEDVSSNYAEANSLGRENPILQFTRGDVHKMTFEARFQSLNVLHEVNSYVEALKRAVRRDEDLKRPPVYYFIWGTVIHEAVIVESIGSVKYDQLRPDGLVRGVTMSITLKKYVPFDLLLTNPNSRKDAELSTFKRVIKSNAFWEAIAVKQFGDAILGTVLAEANRSPLPQAGATIILPSKSKMQQAVIVPKSPPLNPTQAGINARSNLFKLRNARVKISTIITRAPIR